MGTSLALFFGDRNNCCLMSEVPNHKPHAQPKGYTQSLWIHNYVPIGKDPSCANTCFTVPSSVSRQAVTFVLANVMETRAPIMTRPWGTRIRFAYKNKRFKSQSIPLQSISRGQNGMSLSTYLAVFPCKAVGTGAVVFPVWFLTGPSIAAGSGAA